MATKSELQEVARHLLDRSSRLIAAANSTPAGRLQDWLRSQAVDFRMVAGVLRADAQSKEGK